MKALYRSLLFVLPLFFATCDESETMPRDYPRLHTLGVTNVNEEGVTLNVEFTYRGNFEILRYGFVWSESDDPSLENSERVIFAGNIRSTRFSATISSTLVIGKHYYARPFVQTEAYIVYGATVKFTSRSRKPPVITGFVPGTGNLGDTISISGKGFSYNTGVNKVQFNSILANVVSATDTLIRVIVPNTLPDMESSLTLEIAEKKTTAAQKFILNIPQLLSATETSISVCDNVIFNVANIGPGAALQLFFNGRLANNITILENQIIAEVPFLSPDNLTVQIYMSLGAFSHYMPGTLILNPNYFTLEPERFSYLDTVTMYFTNMNHCSFELRADGKLLQKLEETGQYIKAIVPANLGNAYQIEMGVFMGDEIVFREFYNKALDIHSLTPSAAHAGETIVIKGRGFHPTLQNNIVCFGCSGTSSSGTHAEIISGDIHTLTVKVPSSLPAAATNVRVFIQDRNSGGNYFVVE